MDNNLMLLMTPPVHAPGGPPKLDTRVRLLGPGSPEIEVETPDGPRKYTLKPLAELYGQGTGRSSIDPRDDTFLPLLMAIEEPIVRYNEDVEPSLTDGRVLLVVKQMGIDPDTEPSDPLGREINVSLRLIVSLNDYSRQDVKGCLRQISKSVERHTRADGPRGYVRFIQDFLGRKRRRY